MLDKVLLINEGASDNIGDQALNKGLHDMLKKHSRNVTQVDFTRCKNVGESYSNNAALASKYHTRSKLPPSNFRLLLSRSLWFCRNFFKAWSLLTKDVQRVFIGGGQLILDNRYFPIALFTWSIIAKAKRVPVCITFVGVGKDFSWLSKKLISIAMNNTTKIIVRDNVSRDNLVKNFGVKAITSYDSAYSLTVPKKNDNKQLLAGVTSYEVYFRYFHEVNKGTPLCVEDYIDQWLDNILAMINKFDIDSVIFCSTSEEDLSVSFKAFSQLKERFPDFDCKYVSEVPSLNDFLNIVASSSVCYSGRMHALILSEVIGLDIKPYNISQKIESYNHLVLSVPVLEKMESVKCQVFDLFNQVESHNH